MKKQASYFWIFLLLVFSGCEKKFASFLTQAREDFSSHNYINTVDNLNVGLLHWKESDGNEAKAEAYQLIGQAYQQLRNTDKAIEAYKQAVQLSTQTFTSAYALGMLFLTRSQPSEGLQAFQKALQMKSNDPMALLGLANCLYSLRRYKEAQESYQKVVDTSPGVRDALESLSALKSRMRQSQTTIHTKQKWPVYKSPGNPKEPPLVIKKTKKKK